MAEASHELPEVRKELPIPLPLPAGEGIVAALEKEFADEDFNPEEFVMDDYPYENESEPQIYDEGPGIPPQTVDHLRRLVKKYDADAERLHAIAPVAEYLEGDYDDYVQNKTYWEGRVKKAYANMVAVANHAIRGIGQDAIEISFSESDNPEVTKARIYEIIGADPVEEEPEQMMNPTPARTLRAAQ